MKTPFLQARRRKSRVAGMWGVGMLYSTEWGGLVMRSKSTLADWNGLVFRTPWHHITFVFRRRELRL